MIRVCTRSALFFSAVVFAACLAAPSFAASDRGFANYDGDTVRATFRIANIDAPEIQGKCDYERKLAVQAKEFTRVWLAKGHVTIKQTGIDRYGRVLATVERNGEDLGEALIKAKLARPWVGKRQPWC
jgi:endonuclease YncB( thermonuclease family)